MPLATLRRETAGLAALANRDLDAIWRLGSTDALYDLLPLVVVEYGAAGAALAADWFEDERSLRGIPGAFSATPVDPSDRGTQALIGWASSTASDDTALRTLVEGGVQRRIADHVRYTIIGSTQADPRSGRWQRVGTGRCDFCRMLIGRGAVYRSDATASFDSHDHCGCSAVPVWT